MLGSRVSINILWLAGVSVLLHPMPKIDDRLAEMNFGDWEGRPWDSIPRLEIDAWAADVAGYAPPGGESPRDLQRRALDFVASLTVLALDFLLTAMMFSI